MPQAWAAAAERESRQWSVTCRQCGRVSTIWDEGGLRRRARGTPLTALRCPTCNAVRPHRVERKNPPPER
jgi:uncharacterized protein YlaI